MLMIIQILFLVNFCVHMSVAGGALCADQTRHYTYTQFPVRGGGGGCVAHGSLASCELRRTNN